MRAGEGGKGGGTKVTDEVNVTHVIKVYVCTIVWCRIIMCYRKCVLYIHSDRDGVYRTFCSNFIFPLELFDSSDRLVREFNLVNIETIHYSCLLLLQCLLLIHLHRPDRRHRNILIVINYIHKFSFSGIMTDRS